MTAKTHMVGGIALASAATTLTGIYEPYSAASVITWGIAFLAPATIGALAPDMDHGNSKAANTNILTKIASIIIRITCGHRGMLHSPFFLAILGIIGYLITEIYPFELLREVIVGFLIGYGSHLIIDLLNASGIPLLFPLLWEKEGIKRVPKKQHLLRLPEGGIVEWLVWLVLVIIVIYFVYPQITFML